MSDTFETTLTTDQMMLAIEAIDPTVNLRISRYTGQWYVDTSCEIGDGVVLISVSIHRRSPVSALHATFQEMTSVTYPKYVVSRYLGQRREFIWNGAAFAECTRKERVGA